MYVNVYKIIIPIIDENTISSQKLFSNEYLNYALLCPLLGNGLGMKIVGGKSITGSDVIGAFVTAIYPIIADQLHGELDVGKWGNLP